MTDSKADHELQQKPLSPALTPLVQRQEAAGEEEVQAKCSECEKEDAQKKEQEEVQAQTNGEGGQGNSIEGSLRHGRGGQQMDPQTQSEMESGFGADFSGVKIHDDSEAAQMSQDIGAQAFTHGNDIYFNKGKYNPDSESGKHLLAHELTHTIQQGSKRSIQKQDKSKAAKKKGM